MTAIKELINNTKTEFYFLDQPTKVILEKKDHHLSIIIYNDKKNFEFLNPFRKSVV